METITKADVRALLRAKAADAPVSANRLLALIRRILRWAAREDLIAINPASEIDPPTKEKSRDRVLKMHELLAVWHAADELGYPFGSAVKMLILTAQRRDEVGELAWREISGSDWHLPDDRAKNGDGCLVPLSPLAVSILEEAPVVGDPPTYVFTTGRRRTKGPDGKALAPAPVQGWSWAKERLDALIVAANARALEEEPAPVKHGIQDWTLHDIRRSVVTNLRDSKIMGNHRIDRLTVSKILNHAEGGMTRIYDRYSNDPEKREALEAWADKIEQGVGLNVLPLPRRDERG